MAAMMLMLRFSPRPHHFFTAWLCLCGFHFFFVVYKAPKISLWLTLGFVCTHVSSYLYRHTEGRLINACFSSIFGSVIVIL